jgi:hypothetical protein
MYSIKNKQNIFSFNPKVFGSKKNSSAALFKASKNQTTDMRFRKQYKSRTPEIRKVTAMPL